MKTVTVRGFYHNAELADALVQGKQLNVTANGKPKFAGSKGARPQMTRKLAERRSVGNPKAPRFGGGTAFLGSLKK